MRDEVPGVMNDEWPKSLGNNNPHEAQTKIPAAGRPENQNDELGLDVAKP